MRLVDHIEDTCIVVFPRAIQFVGFDLIRAEQFCQERIFKQFINLIDARQQTFIMLSGDLYKVQVVGGHSLAVNNIRNDQGNLTFG